MRRPVLSAVLVALFLALGPERPLAQDQDRLAAVLEGIERVAVMPVDLSASPAHEACQITEDAITEAILEPVHASGLQGGPLADVEPFAVDTPGLYLIPVIATLQEGRFTCISWVGLRAQSAHYLTLPSTQRRKTVQVLYWDRGVQLSSAASGHGAAVAAALQQLAQDFTDAWRRDQGTLPLPDAAGR